MIPINNNGESGFKTLKQSKLQMRARESILGEIKNGAFPDGKLPTERKLAELLGVSRATISITLAYMEREGIVVRRHGSATYVNLGYNSIHSLITQGIGVYDLIKQNNYVPSLISNNLEIFSASTLDSEITSKLNLSGDERILLIRRIFGANQNPAVLTEEYIPEKFLTKPIDINNLPETIYKLSEQYCISTIEFTLVEIIPYYVDKFISEQLKCTPNEMILLTEEVHLNNRSAPMIFSKVFVLDKYIRFQAIRVR